MSLPLSRFFIFLSTILFSFSLLGIFTIYAAGDSTTIILEELPGIDNAGFKAALQSDHPGEAAGYYINGLLTLGIGLATVLAVLMITIGGFQYITTDSFMQKSEGKKKIQDSLMGLGLILVSYLLLGTINSDLLKIRFGLSPISLKAEPLSMKFDIEDITKGAVENIKKNNQKILEKCGKSTDIANGEVKDIGDKIKELENYKKWATSYGETIQKTEDGRTIKPYTHVKPVGKINADNPDSWFRYGYYDAYRPQNYTSPELLSFKISCKKGGDCLLIKDYINFMDRLIASLMELKKKCESQEKNPTEVHPPEENVAP